jgi:hypothetical protein
MGLSIGDIHIIGLPYHRRRSHRETLTSFVKEPCGPYHGGCIFSHSYLFDVCLWMVFPVKKVILISMISLIIVALSVGTKVINAPTVAETDAASYDEMVITGYIIMGVLMILVAFWTYRIHIVAGIIPWGLGLSALGYGLYLAYCKGMMPV